MADLTNSPEHQHRPSTPPLQSIDLNSGPQPLQPSAAMGSPDGKPVASPQKNRSPFKFKMAVPVCPATGLPSVIPTTPPRPLPPQPLTRTPPRVPPPPLIPLEEPPQPPQGFPYTMGGINVVFPVKAYKSQVAIMSKVITGLRESKNCLLESPTGSGKTLALLCSALAWQKHEKDVLSQQQRAWSEESARREDLSLLALHREQGSEVGKPAAPGAASAQPCSQCIEKQAAAALAQTAAVNTTERTESDSSDDEYHFKPAKKKQRGVVFLSTSDDEGPPPPCACKTAAPAATPQGQQAGDGDSSWIEDDVEMGQYPTGRVPQIFYGTRTHKQIQQVVRELKKTVYKNVKMTILASRNHTCLLPEIPYKSKTERCHELLDPRHGMGCSFKSNVDKTMKNHRMLAENNCPEPFDIEDLVSLGRQLRTCPYFSARSLLLGAELIFCPYQYLIDPHIVSSMSINFKDNVIIFDEAHNIEDMAREAASYTVDRDDVKKAADDCKIVAINKRLPDVHRLIEDFLVKVSGWIVEQEDRLANTEDYNKYSYTCSGLEAIASFENAGIGKKPYSDFKNSVNYAIQDIQNIPPKEIQMSPPCMTALTKNLLQALCFVLDNLYDNDMAHQADYRIAVIKQANRRANSHTPTSNRWINMGNKETSSQEDTAGWQYTLNFWCQNPAIAMRDMRDSTRCVILTSGTLAPVDSFSSELGMRFPIQFEADHVITPSQVYVTSVPSGPHRKSLNAQWSNAETFDFQDELGRLVLDVCQTVPYGVLCFFPSYKLLEKLTARWKSTGMWTQLELCKNVFSEPRIASKLDDIMTHFRLSIDDPSFLNPESSLHPGQTDGLVLTGALLFAVHRGKVSEGIDFADNQARAVIAVGIPYPNFKDEKVVLKREYNDQFCQSRGLLTGKRWYDIQAYRALNQALGRCIRHRNDWGAILLVDDRFVKGKYYTDGLSKWVRTLLHHKDSYAHVKNGLKLFTESRLEIMRNADSNIA